MDEDYARKLRAWLKSEPHRAEEEREWLREVPAPEGGCSTGDRPRAADEPLPAPASDERWTVRGRLPREPVEELEEEWVCPVIALPVPRSSEENGCRMSAADERRSRDQRRPDEGAADQPGVSEPAERSWNRRLPGETSAQPGTSETAEQRPQLWHPEGQPTMSDAEARSRWNHPSNWHRRRRAAQADPDQPGSH